MRIRKLREKDAPFMLEWMHDDFVVRYLRKDFMKRTMDDCLAFIKRAQDESENIHLAIVNDADEYMGTVSLKHICRNTAEFGIAMRVCARGLNYAQYGMKEIFDYGYRNKGIKYIYWCVDPENKRALRFYDGNGYHTCDVPPPTDEYTEEERQRYIWYHDEI